MSSRRQKSLIPTKRAISAALAVSLAHDGCGTLPLTAAQRPAPKDYDGAPSQQKTLDRRLITTTTSDGDHRSLTERLDLEAAPELHFTDWPEISQRTSEKLVTTLDGDSRTFGVMFDVKARRSITVQTINFNAVKTDRRVRIEIWTKRGSFEGNEKNKGAWTLWAKTSILGRGSQRLSYIPRQFLNPIKIPRSEKQAFYIFFPDGAYLLSSSNPTGREYHVNRDLVLYADGVGTGRKGFDGNPVASRLFSGVLKYETILPPGTTKPPTPRPTPRPTRRTTPRPTPQPTPRPTMSPNFRLRLNWEQGYRWQGSRSEMWYCMEWCPHCDVNAVYVNRCDNSIRQKFLVDGETIRPTSDPTRCFTTIGYANERRPIMIERCIEGSSSQKFVGYKDNGRFELSPKARSDMCLSQQHHPKPYELVYPENCETNRRTNTAYWIRY